MYSISILKQCDESCKQTFAFIKNRRDHSS